MKNLFALAPHAAAAKRQKSAWPTPATALTTPSAVLARYAREACVVPWRSETCAISCASTPASSPSVRAASTAPSLTKT